MKRSLTKLGNLIDVQSFMQEEQMATFVTRDVVSQSDNNCELRLVAHSVDGTVLPEELELLGNVRGNVLEWSRPQVRPDRADHANKEIGGHA